MSKTTFAQTIISKLKAAIGTDGSIYTSGSALSAMAAVAQGITEYLIANTTVSIAYAGMVITAYPYPDPIISDTFRIVGTCAPPSPANSFDSWIKQIETNIIAGFQLAPSGNAGVVFVQKPFLNIGIKTMQENLKSIHDVSDKDPQLKVWEVVCGGIMDWINSIALNSIAGPASRPTAPSAGTASITKMTEDKSNAAEPVFDSLWGNLFDEDEAIDVLICNIIIPEAYWDIVRYENGEMTCRFTSVYVPDTRHFRVRLVGLKNGQYGVFNNIRGEFGIPVNSYALSKNIAAPISACMLPYIDIDGEFIVKMVQNYKSEILDKAYIYSSKSTDISINYSDDQASQLLTLCAPGKSYRYPTTGVGITKYLNCIVAHSDLHKVLEAQFDADNKPIQDADFDNETCKLDVLFNPEKEVVDPNLEDLENLNLDFFSMFTDEY